MVPTENPYGSEPELVSNLKRMSRWFKSALWALLVVAMAGAISLRYWRDDAMPDDSAMLPVWEPVADDNPLARFQNWMLTRGRDLAEDARLDILEKVPWDAQSADSLLKDRQMPLYDFKNLADEADQPWKWSGASRNGPLEAAADLTLIKAMRLSETGKTEGALESAQDLFKCGAAIKRARGGLADVSSSSKIIVNGARAVECAARAVDLGEKKRREISDLLAKNELKREDLKFAFQANYTSPH